MLDPVANFVKLTVSGGYDQNDTSITLISGGSSLPSTPFNVTWWNSTDYADPSDDPNAEIVRVNGAAISGNTLPITRAQEGTAASTKNTIGKTYKIILGATAKTITDIGANLHKPWNAPQVVSGTINGMNSTFTIPTAPADPNSVLLWLAQQPQLLGIDFTIFGTTITYTFPPDASLAGTGHYAQYQ
jgi:hypothetical protein